MTTQTSTADFWAKLDAMKANGGKRQPAGTSTPLFGKATTPAPIDEEPAKADDLDEQEDAPAEPRDNLQDWQRAMSKALSNKIAEKFGQHAAGAVIVGSVPKNTAAEDAPAEQPPTPIEPEPTPAETPDDPPASVDEQTPAATPGPGLVANLCTKPAQPQDDDKPRQWTITARNHKQIREAIYSLSAEANTYNEMRGVRGRDEDATTFYVPFGCSYPNLKAYELLREIGKRYDWTVTGKDARAFIEDIRRAKQTAKQHRQTVDNREDPEERDARDAEIERQNAEREARRREIIAQINIGDPETAEQVEIPEGFDCVTIEAVYDNSDSMTDYYEPDASIGARFVLATMPRQRARTEATLRGVVARFPELAAMDWQRVERHGGIDLETGPIGTFRHGSDSEKPYRLQIGFYYRGGGQRTMPRARFEESKRPVSTPFHAKITAKNPDTDENVTAFFKRCQTFEEAAAEIAAFLQSSPKATEEARRGGNVSITAPKDGDPDNQLVIYPSRGEDGIPAGKWFTWNLTERCPYPPTDNHDNAESAATNPHGAKVTRNAARGGIEITFPRKPPAEVIALVKRHGFRWSGRQKLWYARDAYQGTRYCAVCAGLGIRPDLDDERPRHEDAGACDDRGYEDACAEACGPGL